MGDWAIFWIISLFAVPGIIMGIVLCCGKGTDLVAGFHTMSPEEKAVWNEPALCRGVGVLLLAIIACIEWILAAMVLGWKPLIWTGVGLMAVLTAGGVVYLNKSPRFRKK